MELVRWNPWGNRLAVHSNFDRLFDEFFSAQAPAGALSDSLTGTWNPAVDVFEEDAAYVIKAELPGIDKKDITLDVNDGVLTLKGERNHEAEVKKETYYRREMAYGTFQRSFRLPVDVNADLIKADYKDGVLRISIPKPEERKPRQITVH